jgi:hypothetical protein
MIYRLPNSNDLPDELKGAQVVRVRDLKKVLNKTLVGGIGDMSAIIKVIENELRL